MVCPGTGIADAYTAGLDPGGREITTAPALVATRYTGSTLWADWSPDGRSLAYTSVTWPSGTHKVVVRSMASGEESEFSPGLLLVGKLRWARDGRSIFIKGFDERRRPGLYRFHLATGELETVLLGQHVVGIEPSLDGRAISYVKDGTVFRHDLASGRARPIEGPSEFITSCALSPDGWLMALSGHSDKAWRLLVIPTAGGDPRTLFESEMVLAVQAWTRDGDALLFTQHDEEQSALWWISAKGGAPQQTGLVQEGLGEVRVHPDGNRISFIAGNPTLEVWVMENFLPTLRAGR